MAIYKNKDSVLLASLGEYASCGFDIIEIDSERLAISYLRKIIGIFNQKRVTIEAIRKSCQNYLDSLSKYPD